VIDFRNVKKCRNNEEKQKKKGRKIMKASVGKWTSKVNRMFVNFV